MSNISSSSIYISSSIYSNSSICWKFLWEGYACTYDWLFLFVNLLFIELPKTLKWSSAVRDVYLIWNGRIHF